MEFVYNPMTGSAGFPVYSPLIKDTRAIISAVTLRREDGSILQASSNYRLLSSAATTNAALLKSTPGAIFRISGINTVALKRYLKLYNKATAPTVGTDVPLATYPLMANAGFSMTVPEGMEFSLGIGIAITAGIADNDSAIIGVGDIEGLNILFG